MDGRIAKLVRMRIIMISFAVTARHTQLIKF